MNTSPILPGLAREQIAPQLLWSRRLPDGRDMSAQEWLTGNILTPSDMNRKQIIDILTRLHCSRPINDPVDTIGICNGNTFGFTSVMGKQGSGCFKKQPVSTYGFR